MKTLHILAPLFILLAISCVREIDTPSVEDGGSKVINFGFYDIDDITISTKMALSEGAEQRVVNMYVLLFNNAGKRVFGQYLDTDNRLIYSGSSTDEYAQDSKLRTDLPGSGKQWYVINHTTVLNHQSHGQLYLKMPDVTNGEIHIIANLDPALMNVSEDRLNYVTTKTQLQDLVVSMTQKTGFRSGSMLMHGYATGVTVNNSTITIPTTIGSDSNGTVNDNGGDYIWSQEKWSEPSIFLNRLDARITVNVKIDPTNVTENSDGGTQRVTSFTPESWQIINIPESTNLYAHAGTYESPTYFNSLVRPFESSKANTSKVDGKDFIWYEHSFEYYQLETNPSGGTEITGDLTQTITYNEESKTITIPKVQLRDRKVKDAKGEIVYDLNGYPTWQYAPQNATYMILKGEVMLEPLNMADGLTNKTMNAQVVYYVHLGDWGTDVNDYKVLRNHHYTYNITIKGVNAIEWEVVYDNNKWNTANEQNSGAEGGVYRTKEGLFKCDAHFEQRVFPFAVEAMPQGKKLTWYTSSPFGRAGSPDQVGSEGIEIPTGLDYKWVHFHVNSKFDKYKDLVNDVTKEYGDIRENRYYIPESAQVENFGIWAPYGDGDGSGSRRDIPYMMDAVEFCKFLREQKELYWANKPSIFNDSNYGVEEEVEVKVGSETKKVTVHRIYVTVFVDEYYYNAHPTSDSPMGWGDFVGAPDRVMHILCDSFTSADDESFLSNSVVSVMQRSIQSVYKSYAAASGWGIETIDETADINFFWNGASKYRESKTEFDSYGRPIPATETISISPSYKIHNDLSNGLFNTAAWWNLLDNTGAFVPNQKWQTYLDFARQNEYKVTDDGLKTSLITKESGDIHFLKEDPQIANLRYACMSRNRDENGNGFIDASEVKWYLASQRQLALLYIGDSGLRPEAKLFQNGSNKKETTEHRNGDVYPWRQHVISSTSGSEGFESAPTMIWAEEGTSISNYKEDVTYNKMSYYYIRCVRNLGMDPETETAARTAIANVNNLPITLAATKKFSMGTDNTTDDVYCFDLRNMNEFSMRDAALQSDESVFPGDENSYLSRPYYGFITGPLVSNSKAFSGIKSDLERGTLICPENYHVPNIREASLMYFYAPSLLNGTQGVSTYYSFGYYGHDWDILGSTHYATWQLTSSRISLDSGGVGFIPSGFRCIRDLEPDEIAEVMATDGNTPPAL